VEEIETSQEKEKFGNFDELKLNKMESKEKEVETDNREQNKVKTMLDAVSYKVYAEKNVNS
jgi:hypothetical protein